MFSRSWRIFQLMFPGTGSETRRPNDVSQLVQPQWDIFRLQLGETYIRTESISNTNGGAVSDITQQFTSAGQAKGRIQIPVSLCGYNDSAASLRVDVKLSEQNTTDIDPWGRFGLGTFIDIFVGGCVVTNGVGGGGVRNLPMPMFVPRTNLLTVVWRQVAAGKTVACDYCYLDIPGELFQHVPAVSHGSST